jgi:hypothetical protein
VTVRSQRISRLAKGLTSWRRMFTCGGAEKPSLTEFLLIANTLTSIPLLMQIVSPFFRDSTNMINLLID